MDFNFLNQSSEIAPVLLRLSDTHKVYDLANDKSCRARQELAEIICGLLDMELSTRECQLVSEVLVTLIRQAEKDLRYVIAQNLAALSTVPLSVVKEIAIDEIDIASPILRQSPVFGDVDLAHIIKSKGALYWREIAMRPSLSEPIANMLADTEDVGTAVALVKNNNIVLSSHSLGVIAGIARGRDELARHLIQRTEVSHRLASELYAFVGSAIQDQIMQRFGNEIDIVEMNVQVDDLIGDVVQGIGGNDCEGLSSFDVRQIVDSLKNGKTKTFISLFARLTRLDDGVVEEVMAQKSGQGLAIVAKAFGIPKQEFMSLFLMGAKFRGQDGNMHVRNIAKAVSYFDRVDRAVAQEVVKNSLRGGMSTH